MEGKLEKAVDVHRESVKGLGYALYKHDTTSGQYGAPIQIKNMDGSYETIGVHAGFGGFQ